MIEEKNLKKGFIIATLMSTVVGTFTATMALHDKVKERRDKAKQSKKDGTQDVAIKVLSEKVDMIKDDKEGDKGKDHHHHKKDDSDSEGGSDRGRGKKKRNKSRQRSQSTSRSARLKDQEAFIEENAQRSKDLIQQTFQENVARFGPGYANGDCKYLVCDSSTTLSSDQKL